MLIDAIAGVAVLVCLVLVGFCRAASGETICRTYRGYELLSLADRTHVFKAGRELAWFVNAGEARSYVDGRVLAAMFAAAPWN